MTKIEGTCREVLDKTEWVAIATCGKDGPHNRSYTFSVSV